MSEKKSTPSAAASGSLDWFVLTKKTTIMQRLSDLIRTGHTSYVEGQIPAEKAPYFAAKLDALYLVGQNKLQASRHRKAGNASFRLLMLASEGHAQIRWYLLRTDGRMPAEASREKWRDALSDRITLTGYELVRLTKPGAKAPVYTWRYTKDRAQDLREAILHAIRTKRDDELRQLIHSIFKTPGFAGARDQVKKMVDLIKDEWKRSRSKADPLPDIPTRLGYVRRLPDVGLKLSELGVKVRSHR